MGGEKIKEDIQIYSFIDCHRLFSFLIFINLGLEFPKKILVSTNVNEKSIQLYDYTFQLLIKF